MESEPTIVLSSGFEHAIRTYISRRAAEKPSMYRSTLLGALMIVFLIAYLVS